jgi:hypothetical protein
MPADVAFLWIPSQALGFVFLGVVLVALTNHVVNWSSSDEFCGTACYSMTWVTAAYQQSPHYFNSVGVRASCGECHIPYDSSHATAREYVKLLCSRLTAGSRIFGFPPQTVQSGQSGVFSSQFRGEPEHNQPA